jgi:hypothetical protein
VSRLSEGLAQPAKNSGQPRSKRTHLAGSLLAELVLLLTLPAAVKAQCFNYSINDTSTNGFTITITGYTCLAPAASVTIPNTINGMLVTKIGDSLFAYYGNLTNVTIPSSVTSIGEGAFLRTGLTSVTIPARVTYIGGGAFYECMSLTNVYFQGSAPSLGDEYVFYGDPVTIYYLSGATGWGATTYGGRPAVLWNPKVPTSDASFGVRTNQFGFTITGTSNLFIVVEACTNLANPIWSAAGTNTLTSGFSYFSDAKWTNYPARFYRLRSL